jgi:hypothetical protein
VITACNSVARFSAASRRCRSADDDRARSRKFEASGPQDDRRDDAAVQAFGGEFVLFVAFS